MRAHNFVTELDELHQELHKHIADAQCRYQTPADFQRQPPDFLISSQAFIKAQFFQITCPSKKIADKFLGPYNVLAWPGTHSITLQPPNSLWAVHPVFHVSMLELAIPNWIPNWVQPPLLPIMVDNEPEFEISEILNSKIDNCHCTCKLLYVIHWTGYKGTDEATCWILTMELGHTSELVADFHTVYLAKSGPIPSLT